MGDVVRSWDPGIAGITEVLHARFVEHAYPLHTHDTWTLLLVDAGGVHYDLDRRAHDTGSLVTLLPPHVPHDRRSRTPEGFRKRVLYLDADALPPQGGRAVDDPELPEPAVARAVAELHDALLRPEPLDVESRTAVLLENVSAHLARTRVRAARDVPLAARLRELLDAHVLEGVSLAWAATELGASTAHLARTFTREVGMSPHAYLVARRSTGPGGCCGRATVRPRSRRSRGSTTRPT